MHKPSTTTALAALLLILGGCFPEFSTHPDEHHDEHHAAAHVLHDLAHIANAQGGTGPADQPTVEPNALAPSASPAGNGPPPGNAPAAGQGDVIAPTAPPTRPGVVEPPPSPRPGFVWVPGHWQWGAGGHHSSGHHWLGTHEGHH